MRASGRVTVSRLDRPLKRSSTGRHECPPDGERLVGRTRQRDDRHGADPADRGRASGLQRKPMRDDLAAPGHCHQRRIRSPDAAAADHEQQIAGAYIERFSDRSLVARRGLNKRHVDPGLAQTSRDQLHRDDAAGNIDHAHPRPSRGAAKVACPPGADNPACIRDFAALPANALPRNCLRQHLYHRPGSIDRIVIEHAIATIGNPLARLDPNRLRHQRQRRVAGRADQVGCAQRPAIDGGDILRRPAFQLGHPDHTATCRIRRLAFVRRDRLQLGQQRAPRHIKWRQCSRQALGGLHDARMSEIEPEIHSETRR